jgi:hypothetical protein
MRSAFTAAMVVTVASSRLPARRSTRLCRSTYGFLSFRQSCRVLFRAAVAQLHSAKRHLVNPIDQLANVFLISTEPKASGEATV